ncbi:sigma-70 family RNA polymerase sigma factor [Streptomyces sp. NRRL F-5135]|uniref:sigma-70 family RNA polymerase sigma factor n=1 Tax=Streptomyces sp. NRRL F-5135 TaxID=1463858 RepID=UPI000AEF8D72
MCPAPVPSPTAARRLSPYPARPRPPAPAPDPRGSRGGRHDAQVTAWALAAGGGDREAAERFVRATYGDVKRFVTYLDSLSAPGRPSVDAPAADDLAQETYLRALPGLAGFAGRSCARTWLLSIARRVVVDRHRGAAARPRLADATDWQAAAERSQARHLPGFEEGIAVFDALDTLDPPRRQAFVLTQLLGLTYAEAAHAVGCPVGTVRSRVARARRDLTGIWRADAGPAHDGPADDRPDKT